MKKRNILKENKDFNKIIKENRGYKYKDFIVYFYPTLYILLHKKMYLCGVFLS